MFGVVIHDSFVHELPFYYILYLIGGLFIGRLLSVTQKFTVDEEIKKITVEANPLGITITLGLLVIRFFAGNLVLAELHVV